MADRTAPFTRRESVRWRDLPLVPDSAPPENWRASFYNWPELKRETRGEKLRRGVMTARAMPLHERGATQGPLGVALNDLVASVPLPEDIAGIGQLLGGLAQSMDPTGRAAPQGDALKALANWQTVQQMADYAAEHPAQTMASAFGGPAGIAAYREFAPQNIRNFAHMFYGGGKPLTYIRKPLRELATQTEAVDFTDVVNENAARNVVATARQRGANIPGWISDEWPEHNYVGNTRTRSVERIGELPRRTYNSMNEWDTAFGKSFMDGNSRLWDWYQFYPEAYGYQSADQFAKNRLGLLIRDVAMAKNDPLSKLKAAVPELVLALPRYAAMKFGTPYAIDASLTSGDALMHGLAPFSAIGASTIPGYAMSVADTTRTGRKPGR